MSKHNKRLRKKLYLDEFAVLGFEVTFKLTSEDDAIFDGVFNDLVAFMEAQELIMNVAADGSRFFLYVSSRYRYESATDAHRDAVIAFLNEQSVLEDVTVAALSDAYYGN
jgi:uncharacterized protein YggL (DUF469 family)